MKPSLFDLKLRNFPVYAKCLAAGYIIALGFGYFYAMANIALVVGLTPDKVAIHYSGSPTGAHKAAEQAGEQEFSLDAVEAPAAAVPYSFKNLVTEGHFHLFGMAAFFFGFCLIGLFAEFNSSLKTFLVSAPFGLIILDNLSFMATRFLGPSFSYLTMIVGTLMVLNFTALWFFIARDLIKKPKVVS